LSHRDDVFIKVFIGLLAGLALFTVAIIILANTVGDMEMEGISGSPTSEGATAERIRPVGRVKEAGQTGGEQAGKATAAAPVQDGKTVYTTACLACHATGVAGAPRVGDKGAWGPRIAQGLDALNQHALQGIRGMPPKGGRMDLSDAAVTEAVAYMVENSQ